MTRKIIFATVLLASGAFSYLMNARTVVLLAAADPNCIQQIYDLSLLPAGLDPNLVDGLLLPPFPGNPDCWEVDLGKFNRPPTTASVLFRERYTHQPQFSHLLDTLSGKGSFLIYLGSDWLKLLSGKISHHCLEHFLVFGQRKVHSFLPLIIGLA